MNWAPRAGVSLRPIKRDLHPSYFGCIEDVALSGGSDACLVACSEHWNPVGELWPMRNEPPFLIQTIAGTVKSHGGSAAIESVNRAVFSGKVWNVIVCGHRGCNVLYHALNTGSEDWSRGLFDQTRQVLAQHYPSLSQPAKQRVAACEHTLNQVKHLATDIDIGPVLQKGSVKLHAWVYDPASAGIKVYDPRDGQFRIHHAGG